MVADNTWAAFQGRKNLNATWENSAHATYNSDEFKKELQETARSTGHVVRNQGDVDVEFAKGDKTIAAEYHAPHLAHVSMEPPVAVADVRDGKAVIWTSTQNPHVTCHVALLGGGFGRKSKPDYVAEAAIFSKKTGRPVKGVEPRR